MRELYSEKDLQLVSSQLKKRYILMGAGLAALLALLVFSFIQRNQPLSMVVFFLLGAVAVFVVDMFCLPIHRYRKLLVAALSGRTHTGEFVFDSVESEPSMVDGVDCQGLIFLGEPDRHGSREQRFYWDRQLPLPDFRPGDQVTLKYTGTNIIGYRV